MSENVTEPHRRLDAEWRYAHNPRYHDEVLTAEGQVRAHWRPIIDAHVALGHAELARRWQEGRRLIYDNGITYNVYSDPDNTNRKWPLDPIPYLIAPEEWERIEAAVVQRATLLNRILADIYGPQRLLRENLLPPELVFPNPAFHRACWGMRVPSGIHLHIYAADLARSPDGQWWVIADRTQAPSGAGYALENRIVCSQVLPDIFRATHVRRLAGYFQTYRNTLLGLVPSNRENPRVVLLTPGPYNETYFEHAFLARYLGITLVEGGDLMVRENRVYMKTLGGLLPVDVILRRQDDSYCDPLELRGDSMLGVAGLVQAARSGTVAIANALGSGVLESAAPSAFLMPLCRHILNEELKLPSVATWWCGQEGPLNYVLDHLEELVIKPTFPSRQVEPVFGSRLSKIQREALRMKLREAPHRWVAQEEIALSTVPVWNEGQLAPRHLVLRVYAVASGDSYAVMPGGLTRVSSALDSFVVSMQRGGGSKDTWTLASGPTPQISLLRPTTHPLEVSRATFDLPSRVADNLFWLGRYTERVESAVRISRTVAPRILQETDPAHAAGVQAGVQMLATLGYLGPEAPEHPEREILSMIFDSSPRTSLGWNISQVRRVAWLLRDRISADAWRILNGLDQQFREPAPPQAFQWGRAQDRLNHAVITLSAFAGLVMESMTRGHGWRFLDIGRRLERTLQMVEIMRCSLTGQEAAQGGVLETLLEIADSSITYRSRYLTSLKPDLVLDLLLIDEANPRSIAFQLMRLRDHIEQLPESLSMVRRPAEARIALGMLNAVQLADVRELVRPDAKEKWPALEALLSRLAHELRDLSEILTRSYFSHAIPPRRMTTS